MDSVKTGALVSALRREKGLTQRELASLLGVSDKAVSKWERGECFPDITLIPPLAAYLGVTADELLAGVRQDDPPREAAPEPLITRRAEAGIVPHLLDGARERFRRQCYGAFLLVALGFLLRYALTPSTLSALQVYPYLAPCLCGLCGMAGLGMLVLAASRYTGELRQYRALGGSDGPRPVWSCGLMVYLGAGVLFLSLCLDFWTGSGSMGILGENLSVLKAPAPLAIPLMCALAAANLFLRWWGDRRGEQVDGREILVTVLSLGFALLAAGVLVWLQFRAAENGSYAVPDLPQEVIDRVSSSDSWNALGALMYGSDGYLSPYLPYTVPGLQYAVPGTGAAVILGLGGALCVNLAWALRSRRRRTLVCAAVNVAMCGLILLGMGLWFRFAPIVSYLTTGAEGSQFLFAVYPALFDLVAAGALTLRHLVGVLLPPPAPPEARAGEGGSAPV